MRKIQCGNPDPDRDHTKYHGWYGNPDMVRIYIRTSEVEEYGAKPKRRWVPVGMICPFCRWVALDDITEEVSA